MNKKNLKIAGLALGFSMAVAGIGVAVSASQKAVVQADAAAGTLASGSWKAIESPTDINTTDDFLIAYQGSANTYYGTGSVSSSALVVNSSLKSGKTVQFVEHKTGGDVDGYYLKISSTAYLNNNSGTGVASSTTASSVWVINSTDLCVENKSNGNRFLGGSSDGGNIKAYAGTNKSTYPNAHVYAKTFAVTYNANGGSGTVTDAASPYLKGRTATVKSNAFTRTDYQFVEWNTSADGSGQSYVANDTFAVTADTVLYAIWQPAGASYSVTDAITNAVLSSTEDVPENAAVNLTITADEHYTLPASLTVTMGGEPFDQYTYTRGSGNRTASFAIAKDLVKGDLVITGAAVEDAKFSISFAAGNHGTGAYDAGVEYIGEYTLPAFSEISGAGKINADSGYRFVNYTVGGVNKNPGDVVALDADLAITVNFDLIPLEQTYDFSKVPGFDNEEVWSTSYAEHVVNYDEGTVTFASADHNASTITTVPVTKGNDVSFVAKDGLTLKTASFTCVQWGTKDQTITLHYSVDGGANYTSTGITSTNFTIASNNLPADTNAIKITFSSTSNQIGIASLTIGYANTWSASFLDTFTCTGAVEGHPDGDIAVANPEDVWVELSETFAVQSNAKKIELKEKIANEDGDVEAQALARYDLIIRKYGMAKYADFIGRFGEGGANASSKVGFGGSGHATDNRIIAIALIAGIGAIATGAFLFTSRRKKHI